MFSFCLCKAFIPVLSFVSEVRQKDSTCSKDKLLDSFNQFRQNGGTHYLKESDRSLTTEGSISSERGAKPDRAFAINGDFDVSF